MKTYTPLPNKEISFNLNEPTVARERQIHALQVRYPAIDLNERKAICALQKWKPEERIPELSNDVRVSVDALKQLLDRTAKKPQSTHAELEKLCERFGSKKVKAEQVSAGEYWSEIASILFTDFESKTIDPDELNFRVIQEAYLDFFG